MPRSVWLADVISSSLNPALVLLILAEPLFGPGRARRSWLVFWVRSAVAIGLAVALAELGKHYQVWQGHPLFPSGHTAFAVAAASCLVLHRGPRWLGIAVPAVLLMGASLVYGGWHTVPDVVGGAILSTVVTLACFRIFPPRSFPREAP